MDLLLGDTLTRLVFFPALACLPLLFFPAPAHRETKIYTLIASFVELALGVLYVARRWNPDGFPEIHDPVREWISSYGIRYELAIDGISMPLVVLTVALLPLVILSSWHGIEKHWKGFAISLLLLTTGMLGAFLAFDLFLFYVFWEVMLVPMYMIIGIWGGHRRIYAAVKFFLFTMAGSLLMLLAILWLGWIYQATTGSWSFSLGDMLRMDLPARQQIWLFAAFALAFAIKVPMFPLHTWLPDAHVEAPTGGSVILAGVLLKLGTYGFLRFALPMFPNAARRAMPLILALAVVGILYGALVAWMQTDMKKLVAYSSVAHLGFVMLGLAAFDLVAWQGALLQMINHGLSTGALFLLVGMLYDRRHTKEFKEFGGLAKVMPWFAFFLVFSTLASVGLPALNGFVGEFMILAGTYKATIADLRLPVALSSIGVILAAVYLLKMLAQTLWGPITKDENRALTDLGWREKLTLAPLCVFMLWIGVAPQRFLAPSRPALEATLRTVTARMAETPPTAPVVRAAVVGGLAAARHAIDSRGPAR
jgi:NADH-quinone oxidoreductase subunit M